MGVVTCDCDACVEADSDSRRDDRWDAFDDEDADDNAAAVAAVAAVAAAAVDDDITAGAAADMFVSLLDRLPVSP